MSETKSPASELSTSELEVLAALDEHFMCASVIKIRAGYSSAVLVEGIYRACDELVHRGLAEWNGCCLGYRARWRLAGGAKPIAAATDGHRRSPRPRTAS
ncbi:hypothetical protein ASG52_25630 [Methylobacterium sp. Leaf456]|uniref:hypothetical protein n=1 Tax=Methylobacterium sp. Leaf456 TaxID=1736382 RepID=UPI0006F2C98D|nr:hypothetical protein [Methylobacterium sp. Leaf456]KQT52026.1 hypothetical protein ASG52_25630 [Methylobacterium sp. Leaf456]